MAGKLKTVEGHNADRRDAHRRAVLPQPTGIACPRCQVEMVDAEPGVLLLSNPPQKRVVCPNPKCGHRETVVA